MPTRISSCRELRCCAVFCFTTLLLPALVGGERIELPLSGCKPESLPLQQPPRSGVSTPRTNHLYLPPRCLGRSGGLPRQVAPVGVTYQNRTGNSRTTTEGLAVKRMPPYLRNSNDKPDHTGEHKQSRYESGCHVGVFSFRNQLCPCRRASGHGGEDNGEKDKDNIHSILRSGCGERRCSPVTLFYLVNLGVVNPQHGNVVRASTGVRN